MLPSEIKKQIDHLKMQEEAAEKGIAQLERLKSHIQKQQLRLRNQCDHATFIENEPYTYDLARYNIPRTAWFYPKTCSTCGYKWEDSSEDEED